MDFYCQSCRCRLNITGLDAVRPDANNQGRQSVLSGVGSKVDESFILLDGNRRGQTDHQSAGVSGRTLEESFVILAGSHSLIRQFPPGQLQASEHGAPLQAAFDDRFQQLARILELASGDTQVDQPLCLECAAKVREEVEELVADKEMECATYEAALDKVLEEAEPPLSDEALAQRLAAAERERDAAEEEAGTAEVELAAAEAELAEVQGVADTLGILEQRYWHSVNAVSRESVAASDERQALQHRIEWSEAQLQRLQATSVYNDVFRIWHVGPFGTISGFRLGRTSKEPVEWTEINAAWGQAVLLLHTMAQACKLPFSGYRLMPMGSYPRVADRKGVVDLFGPVNKLICTSYDRAQCIFLACLKEFAEAAERWPSRAPFELPFAIEGDTVGAAPIRLTLSSYSKWTKALKQMLADLKWLLARMLACHSRALPAPGS